MRIAIAAAVACLSIIGVTATAQVHAAIRKHTEIPPEPLDLALRTLAKDRGFQVVYLTEDVRALQTRGAVGDFTVDEALKKLLSDSRLEYKFVDENTVSIFPKTIPTSALEERNGASASVRSEESSGSPPKNSSEKQFRLAQVGQSATGPQVASSDDQNSDKKKKEKNEGLSEIVVTGTHIHGVTETSSAARTIDRQTIDQTGATSVGDLMRTLSENFGGGVSIENNIVDTGVQNSGSNHGAATGINLRGLGSDATLVLFNGFRLPFASDGYSVDISSIPLAAIDHVDIVKDGASSIYGSDAVGGVVNFVTRQDLNGVITSGTVGGVTAGHKVDGQFNILGGTTWSDGGFMASYTYDHRDPLDANSRAATNTAADPSYITPDQNTNSFFVGAHQHVGSELLLEASVLYTDRRVSTKNSSYVTLTPTVFDSAGSDSDNPSIVTTARATYLLPWGWDFSLAGEFGQSRTKFSANDTVNIVNYPFAADYKSDLSSGDINVDGPLFDAPGGQVKLAIGGSYRRESFDQSHFFINNSSSNGTYEASRKIYAGYAEVFVPLFGPSNELSGLHRLEVTASDRYDHYNDFGYTNNPKVGILWSPVDEVTARATYSTSFRAPLLQELAEIPGNNFDFFYNAPDVTSPSGTSLQLFQLGPGNASLTPQKATSYTAGLEFHPHWVGGLVLRVDGFDVKYKDRIDYASALNPFLLTNPTLYSAYITKNPTQAQIDAITQSPFFVGAIPPGAVAAIIDDRPQNLSELRVRGLDWSIKYSKALDLGTLLADLNATQLLSYKESLPGATTDRLNTPFYPTRWKLRGDTGWNTGSWFFYAAVNYVNRYTDNRDPTNVVPVDAFLTVDTQVAYTIPTRVFSATGESKISLTVLNLLNSQPSTINNVGSPQNSNYGFNYDPTNANVLGRYVSLTFQEKF